MITELEELISNIHNTLNKLIIIKELQYLGHPI